MAARPVCLLHRHPRTETAFCGKHENPPLLPSATSTCPNSFWATEQSLVFSILPAQDSTHPHLQNPLTLIISAKVASDPKQLQEMLGLQIPSRISSHHCAHSRGSGGEMGCNSFLRSKHSTLQGSSLNRKVGNSKQLQDVPETHQFHQAPPHQSEQ